jgi:hypothetical protein
MNSAPAPTTGAFFKTQCPPMKDFEFQVMLIAEVRVQAAGESVARQVVPSALAAPGSTEIHLANQNNFSLGHDASVTGVDFFVGSIKPSAKG